MQQPLPIWAIEILQCPLTAERLSLASEPLLSSLAARRASGKLTNRLGVKITAEWDAGLVNASETVFYPAFDGIQSLLTTEAIDID